MSHMAAGRSASRDRSTGCFYHTPLDAAAWNSVGQQPGAKEAVEGSVSYSDGTESHLRPAQIGSAAPSHPHISDSDTRILA